MYEKRGAPITFGIKGDYKIDLEVVLQIKGVKLKEVAKDRGVGLGAEGSLEDLIKGYFTTEKNVNYKMTNLMTDHYVELF